MSAPVTFGEFNVWRHSGGGGFAQCTVCGARKDFVSDATLSGWIRMHSDSASGIFACRALRTEVQA